jgi:hypothetical protein
MSSWVQHIIGGAQGANDADNPIASSHKGPITVYLAKVCSNIPGFESRTIAWGFSFNRIAINDVDRLIMRAPHLTTTHSHGLRSGKKVSILLEATGRLIL